MNFTSTNTVRIGSVSPLARFQRWEEESNLPLQTTQTAHALIIADP